jgi:hypothetical protein
MLNQRFQNKLAKSQKKGLFHRLYDNTKRSCRLMHLRHQVRSLGIVLQIALGPHGSHAECCLLSRTARLLYSFVHARSCQYFSLPNHTTPFVPSKRVSPCEASQQCVGPKDTKQPKRQYPANSTQTLGFAWVPHALSRRVGANHLIITSTWNSVLTSQH